MVTRKETVGGEEMVGQEAVGCRSTVAAALMASAGGHPWGCTFMHVVRDLHLFFCRMALSGMELQRVLR